MEKDTLLELLKSKSMTFTFEEIQDMMDEELNKDPNEMDTDLVDLCADIIEKAYYKTEQGITEHSNSDERDNNKRIKFTKILLIAAVIVAISSITIPVCAKYINSDASEKIIQFYSDHFKINLRSGDTNAINHTNGDVDLVKSIKATPHK